MVSGMHTNFSNEEMRSNGSEALFSSMCDKLGEVHEEGIASYGSDNDMRLTGLHETQNIKQFSYGVSDRGARFEFLSIQSSMIGTDI
ncbi:MAG: hypothetical protein Ct9H90mP4_06730 [Gammaproteobacteria bacterium]|nr:MAG: hypothetical protein Ct9H90mP4_06730 [Gammaproteobacteria bacterium]